MPAIKPKRNATSILSRCLVNCELQVWVTKGKSKSLELLEKLFKRDSGFCSWVHSYWAPFQNRCGKIEALELQWIWMLIYIDYLRRALQLESRRRRRPQRIWSDYAWPNQFGEMEIFLFVNFNLRCQIKWEVCLKLCVEWWMKACWVWERELGR